mmetsp:Transcript_9194/g.25782  ORF Transcript_9194/g.25782 Transcript_9194/m.25782 type:complete len:100 (+) Transcript_9194:497-796(+)
MPCQCFASYRLRIFHLTYDHLLHLDGTPLFHATLLPPVKMWKKHGASFKNFLPLFQDGTASIISTVAASGWCARGKRWERILYSIEAISLQLMPNFPYS